jgi:hypothetical protein
MVFVRISEPRLPERLLVLIAQGIFYNLHFLLYLISPRTAHRLVGYFAEDSVAGYTQYLNDIEAGRHENVPAPRFAIDYWSLPQDARLSHVIVAIREDEAIHRDINHAFADALSANKDLPFVAVGGVGTACRGGLAGNRRCGQLCAGLPRATTEPEPGESGTCDCQHKESCPDPNRASHIDITTGDSGRCMSTGC